jgi:hypothetical protein
MEERSSLTHLTILFLVVGIAVNLVLLDIKAFSPNSMVKVSDVSTVTNPATPSPSSDQQNSALCPQSCQNLIDQKIATLAGKTGSPPSTAINSAPVYTRNSVRETYVPLGSGSTTKSTWDDQTGTDTIIDPANYGVVKEVYFIAALRNPTRNGQVYAQLIDVTDGHPAWGSQVILDGPESQTIQSGKITLEKGSKLYRVQLKSTLNFQVFLDNAKVRIISR